MSEEGRAAPSAERLAKVIARSGLCSRRDAEDWIRAGRVAVNGTPIRTPAYNVTARDSITVDGEPLAARSGTRLWLYHKPAGLVVTEKDPEGRPTVFEKLAEAGLPRVLTIGRLDLNTEGLLLLTNDGGLKRVLELPSTGWLRRYRVRAFGSVTQSRLDALQQGIELEGVKYGPIEAQLERQQGSNVWLVVALREGKNREVKNVLASLGLQVNRLIRVSYGPFQLGELPVGAVEVVKSRVLRDQLGRKLAEAAGADFDSEPPETAPRPARERAPERSRRPGEGPSRRPPGRPGDRRDREPARPARSAGRTPRIFFDDGRPPEDYVPPAARAPRGRDRPASDGPHAARPSARKERPGGRAPAEGGRPRRGADAAPGRPERAASPPRGRSGPRLPRAPAEGGRRGADAAPGRPERAGPPRGRSSGPRPSRGPGAGKPPGRPRPPSSPSGRPRPGGGNRPPRKPRS